MLPDLSEFVNWENVCRLFQLKLIGIALCSAIMLTMKPEPMSKLQTWREMGKIERKIRN